MTDMELAIRAGLAETIAKIEPGLDDRLSEEPLAHLRLVAILANISEEADDTLRSAVDAARAAGMTWGQIGDTVHVSRQAAQQRFGRPAPTVDPSRRRVITVTAFTEMERLAQEGRRGWHSVGFGALFHELAPSDEQWQHKRVSVFAGHHDLEADGWQKIGGAWFPWAYYARPTGTPVDPAEREAGEG